MKLEKILFGTHSSLSLHWNATFSFFATEVNTQLKMGIHRGQGLYM